jgi:hypothetical protein
MGPQALGQPELISGPVEIFIRGFEWSHGVAIGWRLCVVGVNGQCSRMIGRELRRYKPECRLAARFCLP